jgi:hypothetical protein
MACYGVFGVLMLINEPLEIWKFHEDINHYLHDKKFCDIIQHVKNLNMASVSNYYVM